MPFMDPTHLAKSAASLTEGKDVTSLEDVMLNTFCEKLGMDSVSLLIECKNENTELLKLEKSCGTKMVESFLSISTNDFNEKFVQNNNELLQCLSSQKFIMAKSQLDSSTYYGWPIICSNQQRAIVVISHSKPETVNIQILDAFIDIYSNFLSVIESGQRDALTGLLNRKTFDSKLEQILSTLNNEITDNTNERRKLHEKEHHWLGVLDIDHFKLVNDNFGHLYGDEVLLLFSKLMKQIFRSNDVLFRYGGEEFVVVLAPCNHNEALMVFDRFRKEVENFDFPQVGKITVSTGIVEIADQHSTLIFENADKALYYAKDNGRNQVADYSELVEKGFIKESIKEDDIELFT